MAYGQPVRRPAPPVPDQALSGWRLKLYTVIFEADTPLGKAFDVALLVSIVLSVTAVLLESVESINTRHGRTLLAIEWGFTILFTIEYVLRLLCVVKPLNYARSFFGIVDLLSILPTFLSLLFPGAQELLTIRGLRLLRLFRVFKLARYLSEADALLHSLRAASGKITVFITTVLIVVVIVASLMHLVEGSGRFGPANPGFETIPAAMYWAIVTMSTVGYGDATPITIVGKFIASLLILLGYSLIIIPTGVISAELMGSLRRPHEISCRVCPHCAREGHTQNAVFCKFCGGELVESRPQAAADLPAPGAGTPDTRSDD